MENIVCSLVPAMDIRLVQPYRDYPLAIYYSLPDGTPDYSRPDGRITVVNVVAKANPQQETCVGLLFGFAQNIEYYRPPRETANITLMPANTAKTRYSFAHGLPSYNNLFLGPFTLDQVNQLIKTTEQYVLMCHYSENGERMTSDLRNSLPPRTHKKSSAPRRHKTL